MQCEQVVTRSSPCSLAFFSQKSSHVYTLQKLLKDFVRRCLRFRHRLSNMAVTLAPFPPNLYLLT